MNELIQHQPGTLQPRLPGTEPSMLEVIQQAITGGDVPAEKLPQVLNAFFEFQLKVQAVDAEREFNRAFAAATMEMPRIVKRGRKDMKEKGVIMYATYEDVDAAIRPIEAKYGFARTFSTRAVEGRDGLLMTLRLTHRAGHAITSERFCRPDPGPGRNDIQAQGSGESYGRRYLTLAVWNIVTVGADDDANSADPISDEQAMRIRDLLDALALTPPNLERFWRMAEATSVEGIQRRKFDEVYRALKVSYDARQKGAK